MQPDLSWMVTKYEESLTKVISLCETPIEKTFLIKVLDYCHKRLDRFAISFIVSEVDVEREGEIKKINFQAPDDFGILCGIDIYMKDLYTGVEILPQFKVPVEHPENPLIERYHRLDFAFHKYNNRREIVRKYDIECDGYEYHNEKVHILKDNTRTRNLLSKNYMSLRYLGTEIMNIREDEIGKLLFSIINND